MPSTGLLRTLHYGSPVNPASPFARNLIGWWKVLPQRVGGTRWLDLAGRWHGVFTSMGASSATLGWGASPRPGGYGEVRVDGSGASVLIPSGAIGQLTGLHVTVSLWLYPVAFTSYNTVFDGMTPNGDRQLSFFINTVSDGYVAYGAFEGNAANFSPSWTVGAWQHAVFCCDGTNILTYRNGVLNSTTTLAIGAGPQPTPWSLGTNISAGASPFNGRLDDVLLWNRTLSASEIEALYHESRRGSPTMLRWTRSAPVFFLPPELPSYAQDFTGQTSVTVLGTSHNLGSSKLRVQVYDASSPRRLLKPARVTVDASTYDVVVTFAQSQSGTVIVNGAPSLTGSHGNYAQTFTGQTSVTVAGATHNLATAALLVDVYDASTPAVLLEPARVTVDASTYDVVVTFAQSQSGTIVVCGYGRTDGTTNHATAFTSQTSVTIAGTTHGFTTSNLGVQVYNTASPAVLLEPARVTVDPVTYDVVVTFAQSQSGTIVLGGSGQFFTGHVVTSQAAMTVSAAGTLPLNGAATLSQGSMTISSTGTLPLNGAAILSQADGTLSAAGTLPLTGAATLSQDGMPPSAAGTLPLVGTATLTVDTMTSSAAGTLPLSGEASLTQAMTLAGVAAVALVGEASLTQAGETIVAAAGLPGQGVATLTQAAMTCTSTAVLPLQATSTPTTASMLVASTGTLPLAGALTQMQDANTVVAGSSAELPNYALGFTSQTSVTILGSTHNLGTAALLIQVYDASSPMVAIAPDQMTVDAVSFDVTVTFGQPQSGLIVLNAGLAVQQAHGNYAQGFSEQTSVTVEGVSHQLGTKNLLVQIYDDAIPRRLVEASRLTVDNSSYDVVATFAQPQSGTIVIGGYSLLSATLNFTQNFTAATSVTITGTTHQLGTANILAAIYNNATPAHLLQEAGTLTVDPLTFDVVATFRQPQSGTIVLNGSSQGLAGQAFLDQDGMTLAGVGTVLVSGTLTRPQASASLTSAGALALVGAGSPTAGGASLSSAGSLTLQGAATLTAEGATLTSAGVVGGGQLDLTQAAASLTATGALLTTGSATLTQAGMSLASTALIARTNFTQAFASATSVTILGTTHQCGTAALLVQVYDTGTPAVLLKPASVTVHPSTFDVTVTFADAQNGTVVLNGGIATAPELGNVAQTFVSQTTVTVLGTSHRLGTIGLLVQAYDAATPAAMLEPNRITVDPVTFDVVVTFETPQSGVLVLCGSARSSATPNSATPFTNQSSITIPGTTHQLGVRNLLVQVYDNATPAQLLEGGSITVHPTTFDVTVSFLDPVSGTVVLNGSQQSGTGQVLLTQGGAALSSVAAVALTGTTVFTLASQPLIASGTLAIAGNATLVQASATLQSTGTSSYSGAAALTQGNATLASTGALAVQGVAALTGAGATVQSLAQVAIAGTVSVTQSGMTSAADGAVTTHGTANLTSAAQSLQATGIGLPGGFTQLTQAAQTIEAAGTVDLAASATLTAASMVQAAEGSVALVGDATLTQAAAFLSAQGISTHAATATLTMADAMLSASAAVSVQGTVTVTQSQATVLATATVPVRGTATPTQANATLAATAVTQFGGFLATQQGVATIQASGTLPIRGTTTLTQPSMAISSTALLPVLAAVTATQPDMTLAADGGLILSQADAALTQAGMQLTATGTLPLTGTLTAQLPGQTHVIETSLPVRAEVAIAAEGASIQATGLFGMILDAALAQDACTVESTGLLALTAVMTPTGSAAVLESNVTLGEAPALVGEGALVQADMQMSSTTTVPPPLVRVEYPDVVHLVTPQGMVVRRIQRVRPPRVYRFRRTG